ncbi:MAG: TIGR03016 family PEP-CTERM system-associated outer membrane protein, partial [Thiobacillus sp.]
MAAIAAAAPLQPANAVDWLFDAGVGGSATYTDNVNQSPSNTEDSLILTVTPNFTLRTEGSRR